MDEKETNVTTTEKEETPVWAQNLQNSLESLSEKIGEMISPSDPQQPQQDPAPPIEIVLPEPPQPDPQPMPEEVNPEQTEEKPQQKKRGFLGWLF